MSMKMFSVPLRTILAITAFFFCVGILIYVMMTEKKKSVHPISREASDDLESIRLKVKHVGHPELVLKSSRHPKKRLDERPKNAAELVTISPDLPTLPPNVVKRIKTFAFFIGYPRSGHSIVGSILDAHPNIVMSHELMFFERWDSYYSDNYTSQEWTARLFNLIYQYSYKNTLPGGSRHVDLTKKGYSLAIESLWQGKFDDHIEVIGDKCGGSVILQYLDERNTVRARYRKLAEGFGGIGIRVMHVLRNPYDTIATRLLYQLGKNGRKGGSAKFVVQVKKVGGNSTKGIHDFYKKNTKLYLKRMREKIMTFFKMVDAIEDFIELVGKENVLTVHQRDLVHDPMRTISSITSFLGVQSDQKYLELCAAKIFKSVSRSRNLVIWPDDLKSMLDSKIRAYQMLQAFTFDSD